MFNLHQAKELFSYKYVMLKSLLESSEDGTKSIHEFFWQFYHKKKINKSIVEKDGSKILGIDLDVFQRSQISGILSAPFDAINNCLEDEPVIIRKNSEFSFSQDFVDELYKYKKELILFVDYKLKKYFMDAHLKTINIWWVNQGKTYLQEKKGGFIWAPIVNKNMTSFAHWDSMTHIKKGDIVINYSKKKIESISITKGTFFESKKELDETSWEKNGRRVNLTYHALTKPIQLFELQQFMESINNTIENNRPFNITKGVNQGYLYNFSVEGFYIILDKFKDRIPIAISKLFQVRRKDGESKMNFYNFLKNKGFYFSQDQIIDLSFL